MLSFYTLAGQNILFTKIFVSRAISPYDFIVQLRLPLKGVHVLYTAARLLIHSVVLGHLTLSLRG